MDKFTLNLRTSSRYTLTVCSTQTGEVYEQLEHIKLSGLENEINFLEGNYPGEYFYDIREESITTEEPPHVAIPMGVFTDLVDLLFRKGNEKALHLLVDRASIKGGREA